VYEPDLLLEVLFYISVYLVHGMPVEKGPGRQYGQNEDYQCDESQIEANGKTLVEHENSP
jgi:hypothetical protein